MKLFFSRITLIEINTFNRFNLTYILVLVHQANQRQLSANLVITISIFVTNYLVHNLDLKHYELNSTNV
jgi:hypothetical protein